MTTIFDPFNDRLARNIRNSLSTALVARLTHQPHAGVDAVADAWLDKAPPSVCQEYIEDCRKQYHRMMTQIETQAIHDVRLQSLLLWNDGLFFELHELLETVWHKADGVERTGLKGLIQAAGSYVHRRRGNLKAANGLARRARINLKAGKPGLDFVANFDTLLKCLENLSVPPPLLVSRSNR